MSKVQELQNSFNQLAICGMYPRQLFIHLYEALPSLKSFKYSNFDLRKIEKLLKDQSIEQTVSASWDIRDIENTYILKDRIIVSVDQTRVILLYESTNEVAIKLISKLEKCRVKRIKQIGIVIQEGNGINIRFCDISNISFSLDNYDDRFSDTHKNILTNLALKRCGVYLLYGAPGTGKTSYINSLISEIDKDFIFISSSLVNELDSPHIISLLLDYKNSVVIIEDAEKLLVNRDSDKNSIIASLLNLTDGFLGQALNIQFICSFNTSLRNVDPALLRKGRLIDSYNFEALSVEKSNKLLAKIGISHVTTEPMILTDIYNFTEKTTKIDKKVETIGFNKVKVA